jgi:putative membrane protein
MAESSPTPSSPELLASKASPADHLANERTLLAWIRTGIGIIAFGFAVVKFSLFVHQLSLAVGNRLPPPHGYSAAIGIALVGLGTLTILLAYQRYRRTEQQLRTGTYRTSPLLIQLLIALVGLVGLVLLVYLISTT